jgi:hypothetical protein
METKNMNNMNEKYFCDNCDYSCSKKFLWEQHLKTIKHKRKQMETEETKILECNICNKNFMNRSGLWKHKKKCQILINNETKIIEDNNKDTMKELVLKLINQNSELQKTIHEMIPNMGNNNNSNNTNIKQKFNINVFLNEKCKDALSMDEFIDKIEVSMKNLLTTKEKGQVYGISNIIMENMNKLSLYERPLHCTDKKRETLYVKNNIWEKDDNKQHINKALKKVESKQLKNLNVWLEEHPNYMNNSLEQEEFAKLMSECGKSVEDGREKIIKKLCDNVYIEKVDDEAL